MEDRLILEWVAGAIDKKVQVSEYRGSLMVILTPITVTDILLDLLSTAIFIFSNRNCIL